MAGATAVAHPVGKSDNAIAIHLVPGNASVVPSPLVVQGRSLEQLNLPLGLVNPKLARMVHSNSNHERLQRGADIYFRCDAEYSRSQRVINLRFGVTSERASIVLAPDGDRVVRIDGQPAMSASLLEALLRSGTLQENLLQALNTPMTRDAIARAAGESSAKQFDMGRARYASSPGLDTLLDGGIRWWYSVMNSTGSDETDFMDSLDAAQCALLAPALAKHLGVPEQPMHMLMAKWCERRSSLYAPARLYELVEMMRQLGLKVEPVPQRF